MRIGKCDTDQDVLIVAEIGNNHEGNFQLAQDLIGLAAEAGAHAVKFQTFITERYLSPIEEARFNRAKGFELTFDQFAQLSRFAEKQGIGFFSTPLDIESARFLAGIQPVFKIASGDNTFYPLIEEIAKTGKPIIVSGGLADFSQLHFSKAMIELVWQQNEITPQPLALLHCVTSYPVPPAEANLRAITAFREEFPDSTIGYSDHTMGIEACVLAVALGARILEKHFTISKSHSEFRDHKLSAEPQELKELVERVREASVFLGQAGRAVQQCERDINDSMRRSIMAKSALSAGHRISLSDITWTRPSIGLAPGSEHLVLGKILSRPLKMGEPITLDALEEK